MALFWYQFYFVTTATGSHEITSRMRTSVLIASRRRLAARFLAAHNFDNFRSIFRLRAFQCDTISCDPLLQSEVTHVLSFLNFNLQVSLV